LTATPEARQRVQAQQSGPKRPQCPHCLRPASTCICAWVVALPPVVEVLILQHPLEVRQAKGSARLLHLSLRGSHMHVGEIFAPTVLQDWLYAAGKTPVLLYPATATATTGHGLLPAAALTPAMLAAPETLRLVVLDGTWRKSRKMLYLNPLLQQLRRLSLQAMPASHYRIRKAHQPDQLSTLEASCYALMQLEQAAEKYAPLLDAFDGFVGQMLAQLPENAVQDAMSRTI
jgi:DTW domain-containing protein YfiP